MLIPYQVCWFRVDWRTRTHVFRINDPSIIGHCQQWSRGLLQCGIIRSKRTFNSLAPGRPGYHFKTAIFNLVLLIGIFPSSNDNTLRLMPWHLTDDKSTLVQVMAWCRQATSHYLSQCRPRSLSPYGVTRPQWVNLNLAKYRLPITYCPVVKSCWNFTHSTAVSLLNFIKRLEGWNGCYRFPGIWCYDENQIDIS